jgi:8-oxo-dGTP pyrophosphatase MutT (NUDIX family)
MAHIHEKIDFTASVYIVFENTVLLHMHKKLGIWLPPGGHIELDEDPNQAVLREAKEETGLEITLVGESTDYGAPPYMARDLVPPRFLNRHFFDATKTHEHVDCVYFARSDRNDARHEIEGGEIRWFTKTELESTDFEILADVRRHALVALQELAS